MDIDPVFAAKLRTALMEKGLLDQLPWASDPEGNETFWAAVDGLTIDQAVRVAEAVRAGIEWGVVKTRNGA